MNELLRFFKDYRFYIPAGFLILLELSMQTGLYQKILKPESYAANVINIQETVRRSPVRANFLILGTSVAYQGVNLPLLNESMQPYGAVFQSGATQGAKLITQHAIFRNIAPDLPETKYMIHISEVTFPWTARYSVDIANRSMLGQFSFFDTVSLMKRYQFELDAEDYSGLAIGTVKYKSDLKDFLLAPQNRLKKLKKSSRTDTELYPYENFNEYGMDVLGSMTTKECADLSAGDVPQLDASGRRITDISHIIAMKQTCRLAFYDPSKDPGTEQWEELYFRRFAELVKDAESRNIEIITVFPPYSEFISDPDLQKKKAVWKKHLDEIYKGNDYILIDLWNSLDGKDNRSLYYDTIHLNRKGSIRFTQKLAQRIEDLIRSGRIRVE